MIIECNECASKVDGTECGVVELYSEEVGEPFKYSLLKCPVCGSPLLGLQEMLQTGPEDYDWSIATRVWPDPDSHLDWKIEPIARTSLEEARKCFRAKAFTACAVMCGRALEAICVEQTGEKGLLAGLKALKAKEVIDRRLYEWGESLRKERNLGAHATGQETSAADARDLLEFATAICEYVYVLSSKYAEFLERKERARVKAAAKRSSITPMTRVKLEEGGATA